jgi:hypothetical protein
LEAPERLEGCKSVSVRLFDGRFDSSHGPIEVHLSAEAYYLFHRERGVFNQRFGSRRVKVREFRGILQASSVSDRIPFVPRPTEELERHVRTTVVPVALASEQRQRPRTRIGVHE